MWTLELQTAFTASTAFKPPNAKLFEIAAEIGRSRAVFGT